MKYLTRILVMLLIASGIYACGSDGSDGTNGTDGTDGTNGAGQVIGLTQKGRYSSGVFDASAAEIVAYDKVNNRTYVVNANSGHVDVLNSSDLSNVTLVTSISVADDLVAAGTVANTSLVGAANSVAVNGNIMAVAVEADPKTDNGWVMFYSTADNTLLRAVQVGALPDMLTFTPDGSKVVVANEGEPDEGYANDPEGSVSVIKVSDYSVVNVGFTDFNSGGTRYSELPLSKMVIDGFNATVAESLEPEYIAVDADGAKAYVSLQENNAIAVINLSTNTVEKIFGLGFKDHSIPGNELDASQKDGVNIKNWPVMGVYMPDTISTFTSNGKTYLVTANEGDSRADWLKDITDQTACEASGYFFSTDDTECVDEFSAKDYYDSDNVTLVNADGDPYITDNTGTAIHGGFGGDSDLYRLKFSYSLTVKKNGGTDFEKLYAYGARSFSIWDAETGLLVYDSGSDFERITANIYGADFNNDNAANAGDDRSDNKGPEPEALAIGVINGHTYAFIGLERMGGIMVYDVSNPYAPAYVQYINNRNVSVNFDASNFEEAGDLGPEGFAFVSSANSADGIPMLIVGNEVSGTTTFYSILSKALSQ
ncbi:choice-of-anchor I family protein [Seleniivibrio sp.]|uniref:choice-of-anchor I family protein n=1 Tax=Seleniivibrio sp. TaxID=2898801 RepID=UPI0025E8710A|nr:choice-of-anchor I family protein [Seleniivibrio sp.]MCD8554406.1 YncE family protein [Seleniivibrio sp.]